ncbi:MAG TPA: SDR family oxidoreductase [Actinomycetota bacterium]|nr:SDR family oxidoreductase [Actinomycetota bacterium]
MPPKKSPVVVVTGASAGVGRAIVREFARRANARIGLLARNPDGLKAARADAEDLGGTAIEIPTDVSDAEAVEAAAAMVERELGAIDIWVNSAMTAVFGEAKDISIDEIRRVTEVTYLGAVNGTLSALRLMTERDEGKIVQVSSALAYRGIPLQSAYCGAKHALKGFTESVIAELAHHGSNVSVTMVTLPGVNTPQFTHVKTMLRKHPKPVPPIYQPEVAARAVVTAAYSSRREIKVGAPTLWTVGGNYIAPKAMDLYLARTGFDSQQTNIEIDPERPNNLWEPLIGDEGAHGIFDEQAHSHSLQLWATTHRPLVLTVGAAAATAAASWVRSRM